MRVVAPSGVAPESAGYEPTVAAALPRREGIIRDLFGEAPSQVAPSSKVGPKGGKHYVKPWGYYAPPGTGPAGETCKTCAHITCRGGVAGRYLKCDRARGKWTGGRKSDILAGSPACSGWESAPASLPEHSERTSLPEST